MAADEDKADEAEAGRRRRARRAARGRTCCVRLLASPRVFLACSRICAMMELADSGTALAVACATEPTL